MGRGWGSLDDSGDYFVVLAGYNEEKDVFALWDADLRREFSYSETVQIKEKTLDGAVENGIETQIRDLKKRPEKEVAIAATPDSLREAIVRRARREHVRSLADEHLPDDWNDSPSKHYQIEEVVLRFLLDDREDLTTEERRLLVQQSVADDLNVNLSTIQDKCGRKLYRDEDGTDYHPDYFDSDLEAIEGDWEASDDPWQGWDAGEADASTADAATLEATDASGMDDTAAKTDSEPDWGSWDLPRDAFETVEGPPTAERLHFPAEDDEPPVTHQIHDALRSGKHVVLTGPPGSGKTELAEVVCDHYVGDDYELATATDDWTTFDTIGGYRQQRDDGRLEFEPGVFLRRFLDPGLRKADAEPEPENEWLVIDELNRADIDKAFGSLFSALTGNNVTLPFDTEGGSVTLHGDPDDDPPVTDHDYYVPDDWRLLATMNTDDKSSLYRLSYAFMRRFAFVSVPVPTEADEISPELVGEYFDHWDTELPDEDAIGADGDDLETRLRDDLADIWSAVQAVRPVGPALVEDVLNHAVQTMEARGVVEYGPAVAAHVLPQLDGVRGDEIDDLLGEMETVEGFDRASAERFAEDFLDADLSDE
ncbi:AAA family ATPase [Halorussus caseinilyticus]|uniref:AAA family ATPase n=1 Tax=Halorussus caseinilyticus TaxID=3034025 RepID=A0ABD5WIH1_9EURY